MARYNCVVAVAAFGLLAGGCGAATDADTSTTTSSSTTTIVQTSTTAQPQSTTTTTVIVGPQPMTSGKLLEPGEYHTTLIEPTVLFRIDRKHTLIAFQDPKVAALQNRHPRSGFFNTDLRPYKGVAVHNHWLRLETDEVFSQLEALDGVEFGAATPVTVGGFEATQFDAVLTTNVILWERKGESAASGNSWWLELDQVTRFIVVETPAGPVLVTIGAHVEEWDAFLPTAEEIVAGISFPEFD